MLLRICLIVAILGAGAVAVVNFVVVQKDIVVLKDDRDTQKKDKETAQTQLATTKKELDSTTKTLNTTKKQLAQTKSDLESANGKIADLDKKNNDLQTHLTATEGERDKFQAELAKWDQLHITPEGVLQLRDDLKKVNTANAGLIAENKLVNSKVVDLQNELSRLLPTSDIVILPTGLKGKILAVDPKYDFVVLNIGNDKGVLRNGIMMVARDGKLLGKVQIAEVKKNESVANILPGWSRGEVMEGDEVLY